MLCLDITFTVLKLSYFLINLSKEHFSVVDRVITYLYYTMYNIITYRGNKESKLLIYRDISFIDNLETRRLLHSYIIILYGEAVF